MQPIPQKVKNVNVYPYVGYNGPGIPPQMPPVIKDATGTYAVGTLTIYAFYNLNLTGGERQGELEIHGSYVAMGELEDGTFFSTPWMTCTQTGENPEFGRTVKYGPEAPKPGQIFVPPYNKVAPLTDITVSIWYFVEGLMINKKLIENGTGFLIATKLGTPHEMGLEVESGDRVAEFHPGLSGILATGTLPNGETYSFGNLTCISSGEPAVFLNNFS